jgi:hypothetical protein
MERRQRDSVNHNIANSNHAAEANQNFVIHFIPADQIGVITKIPQEPVQFPESFWSAVDTSIQGSIGELLGLENCKADHIKRLMCVPLIPGMVYADKIHSIRNVMSRGRAGSM